MKHTWTYIITRRHHHVVESYQLGTILSTTDTKRPDHTKVNVVFLYKHFRKVRYLAGGPHSATGLPSRSGSRSETSSLTMSDPLWNPDVGRGLDRFAGSSNGCQSYSL